MKASKSWSKKQIFSLIFSLVFLATSISLLIIKSANAAYTNCGAFANVQIGNTSPNSYGIVPVYLALNAAPPPPLTIQNVEFYLRGYGNQFLGRGQLTSGTRFVGGTAYTAPGPIQNWMMVWDSSMTIPNTTLGTPNSGPYQVSAIVTYSNSDQCESFNTTSELINNPTFNNSLATNFKNSTNSQLLTSVNLNYGNGINVVYQNFIKDSSGNLYDDVTTHVKYGAWTVSPSTLGSITPSSDLSSAHFTAGTTNPTGYIQVSVEYAGVPWIAKLPVNIVLPAAPTSTYSAVTATKTLPPTLTPTMPPTTTSNQEAVSPAAQVTVSDQSCIIGIIGQLRYDQISQGQSQPTLEEITKLEPCYLQRENIIPTAFAPFKPDDIKKVSLASKSNLSIDKLENQNIKSGNETSKVLVLRGKSYPNQQLFLYIFSVPLVITTKADKDGNWAYTLKNPLSPGKHEVYAVVDRGNGNYEKSSPFAFLIGKARASSSNPNGYSLDLQVEPTPAEDNRAIYFYIAGVVTVVILALVVFILFLKRKMRPKEVLEEIQPNVINPTIINRPMI